MLPVGMQVKKSILSVDVQVKDSTPIHVQLYKLIFICSKMVIQNQSLNSQYYF